MKRPLSIIVYGQGVAAIGSTLRALLKHLDQNLEPFCMGPLEATALDTATSQHVHHKRLGRGDMRMS